MADDDTTLYTCTGDGGVRNADVARKRVSFPLRLSRSNHGYLARNRCSAGEAGGQGCSGTCASGVHACPRHHRTVALTLTPRQSAGTQRTGQRGSSRCRWLIEAALSAGRSLELPRSGLGRLGRFLPGLPPAALSSRSLDAESWASRVLRRPTVPSAGSARMEGPAELGLSTTGAASASNPQAPFAPDRRHTQACHGLGERAARTRHGSWRRGRFRAPPPTPPGL